MSRLDRAAARARCDAATEGPWKHYALKCYAPGQNGAEIIDTPQEAVFVGTNTTVCITGEMDDIVSIADAHFIAHAREDLPASLDLLDELEAAALEMVAASLEVAKEVQKQMALIDRCEALAERWASRDFSEDCTVFGEELAKALRGER